MPTRRGAVVSVAVITLFPTSSAVSLCPFTALLTACMTGSRMRAVAVAVVVPGTALMTLRTLKTVL